VICYLRVYGVEYKYTSAKQRIVLPIWEGDEECLTVRRYLGREVCMTDVEVARVGAG